MIAAELVSLGCALALSLVLIELSASDLMLFAALLGFAVVSDLLAVSSRATKVQVSGSFLSIVLAMALLGGSAAAAIGVCCILAGWLRFRYERTELIFNLWSYAWFPLIGGLVFQTVARLGGLHPGDGLFYVLLFGVYQLSLALNVGMTLVYGRYVEGTPVKAGARQIMGPLLPSELSAALLAVGVAYLYFRIGIAAILLFGIVLVTFQHLLGQLLLSEDRAEQLEETGHELRARTTQLASLQIGVLTALLRTLDLRDRMTARHCAAVARYSREIAVAAGLSEEEQDLVHTAGLLHDIGKFVFPDRILKGDTKLTEEDWQIVKMHPYQGARVVSSVDGYGPVGDVILAHHERIDGTGYPRGLQGEEIPLLSRIISVADIYDVMTARDSYRTPISSFEAIQELQRVAGTQLDRDLVEIFVEILAGKDVDFRHGEDADFDAELRLDKRIRDYSLPKTAVGTAGGNGPGSGRRRAPAGARA